MVQKVDQFHKFWKENKFCSHCPVSALLYRQHIEVNSSRIGLVPFIRHIQLRNHYYALN